MERQQLALQTIREVARPTTIIEAPRLSKRLGCRLTIASETFQHTGSFKFRAAYNLASQVPERMIITASSGNYGQAMAMACSLLGKSCIIVMPHNSAQVKIEAVREYGGVADLVEVNTTSRAARLAELARQYPEARIASAFDDPLVIEGNASLGEEIIALPRHFDYVIAPVGGGGISAGLVLALSRVNSPTQVVGAEPLMANDAARSLREGRIIVHETEPQTIADGTRTVSIGEHNWAILRDGIAGIVEVPEENIAEGVRLLFRLANLKAEPTGALGVGALLTDPEKFRDASVCVVVTGGNVDAELYRRLLAGD